MMWFVLVVLTTTSVLVAQEGKAIKTCKCYPYFYCGNRTWFMTVKCRQQYNEVCCEQDPITPATKVPPTSPTPTSPTPTSPTPTSPTPTSPTPTSPTPTSPTPTSIPDPVVCGVRNKPGFIWKIDLRPGVEYGTEFGEFPWVAAIIQNTPFGQQFVCGGSIIYPNLILTAAHSIKDIPASELLVKTGMWNTTDMSEMPIHQNRTVLRVLLHPAFNEFKVSNDFALLVLNQSLKITENVTPVCLPSTSMPINESFCIATGWGANKYGKGNGDILKKVVLPLIDFDTCRNKKTNPCRAESSFQINHSCIRAANQGETCVGDDGGPLICATTANSGQFVQVGIISWHVNSSKSVAEAYSSFKSAAVWITDLANFFPAIN